MKRYLILLSVLIIVGAGGCSKKQLPEGFDGEPIFYYLDDLDSTIQFVAGENDYILEASLYDNRPEDLLVMSGVFRDKVDPEGDYLRFDFYGNQMMVGALTATDLLSNPNWQSYSIDSIVQSVSTEVFNFYSLAPGNPILSWDFGDGGMASGDSVTHTFMTGGPKNVVMTAQYGGICNGSKAISNSINSDPFNPCRVQFAAVQNGLSFNFNTIVPPNSTFTSFIWDYGNGLFDSSMNGQTVYQDSLDHVVRLTATDAAASCSQVFEALVNVTGGCQASYGYSTNMIQNQVFTERLNENTAVIEYRKNGVIYKSYKEDVTLNQSANVVLSLTGANLYELNAVGQRTIRLSGTLSTVLYNELNPNDSISISSSSLAIAVAIPD